MPAMAGGLPVLHVALTDPAQAQATGRSLDRVLGACAEIVTDGALPAAVRLVSIADLPAKPGRERLVAMGETSLPSVLALWRERPWLDHVISPGSLQGGCATLVAGALWKLLDNKPRITLSPYVDEELHEHEHTIADSNEREKPLEALCAAAAKAGAPPSVVERIRDLAEETITNALYNGPAERGGAAELRSRRVKLERHNACKLSWAITGGVLILRVSDPFGSLSRQRLCEVLERCIGKEHVGLDTSRGGAGLGLWRVFTGASVVMVQVEPGRRTEFLLGVDLRRRTDGRGLAFHLFFANPRKERS
jgi:hypothetical protein